MKRLWISGLLLVTVLLSGHTAFATDDANYDSNGVTTFYGEYEYPTAPVPGENNDEKNGSNEYPTVSLPGESTTHNESELPSYRGKESIVPRTGDTSPILTSLAGLSLLLWIIFKMKEGEKTEKNLFI